jgi:hypothetical protein
VTKDGASDTGNGTSDAGADGGLSTCDGRANEAMAELRQAVDDADKNCSVDTDCTLAPYATDCFAGCAGLTVSSMGQMQVQAAVDTINAGVCADFSNGCELKGLFCPVSPTPLCSQRRCVSDLSCEERTAEASARLDQAVAQADKSCTTNADCTLAEANLNCFAGCAGIAVSVTGAGQVQDAGRAIDAAVCARFVGMSCMLTQPPCTPPPTATCVRGQCMAMLP